MHCKVRSRRGRDRSLEFDFRAQTLQIAMNDRHGQLLAAPAIRDRAVLSLGVELPVELGLVPALGVANVREAEFVLLGPEEWDRIEAFAPTQDVARRRLPLSLGDDPVFDANAFATEPIRPASDVARSEDARDARFQVLIHRDATIGGETGLFGQCDRRSYADADDDQIGRER